MTSYIALVRKDADSDYGVDFPDFPGCVTAAPTLDDVRHAAAEALSFHAEGLIEDGATLPPPATLEHVMNDRFNRDSVAILVDLPELASSSVLIDVGLPQDLVAEIDRRTADRSAFLAEAARAKLKA